jgi:hypothetical protein
MNDKSIELITPEVLMKYKLNKSVKKYLLDDKNFLECLLIIDKNKTGIVCKITINGIKYYIHFSRPSTDISTFYNSEEQAKVYTSLTNRVEATDDRYNFVMFLFLLKMIETKTTEMAEPQKRDDISLFGRITAFDSFKLSYPDDKVNIRDDVILEVPQVVVSRKLFTFDQYEEKCKKDSCVVMGGKKTKRKSKKRIMKRKSKKRMMKRKSKKRMVKRK